MRGRVHQALEGIVKAGALRVGNPDPCRDVTPRTHFSTECLYFKVPCPSVHTSYSRYSSNRIFYSPNTLVLKPKKPEPLEEDLEVFRWGSPLLMLYLTVYPLQLYT